MHGYLVKPNLSTAHVLDIHYIMRASLSADIPPLLDREGQKPVMSPELPAGC